MPDLDRSSDGITERIFRNNFGKYLLVKNYPACKESSIVHHCLPVIQFLGGRGWGGQIFPSVSPMIAPILLNMQLIHDFKRLFLGNMLRTGKINYVHKDEAPILSSNLEYACKNKTGLSHTEKVQASPKALPCVLEQDTYSLLTTGSTQVNPSQHN